MNKYIEFHNYKGVYKTADNVRLNDDQYVGLYSILLLMPEVISKQIQVKFYVKSTTNGQEKRFVYMLGKHESPGRWIESVLKMVKNYSILSLNNENKLEYMPNDNWRLHFYNDDDIKLFGFDPTSYNPSKQSIAKEKHKPFIVDHTILVKTNLIHSFSDDSTISNTLAIVNANSYGFNNIKIKSPIYQPVNVQNDIQVWLTDSGGNDISIDNTISHLVLHIK